MDAARDRLWPGESVRGRLGGVNVQPSFAGMTAAGSVSIQHRRARLGAGSRYPGGRDNRRNFVTRLGGATRATLAVEQVRALPGFSQIKPPKSFSTAEKNRT
jgi:hypothetical protein